MVVVVVQEADVRGVTLCSLMLAAMASSTRRASHDYTEGAAPEDIEQALLNSRRLAEHLNSARLWRRRVRIRFRWSWTCWDTSSVSRMSSMKEGEGVAKAGPDHVG